RVLEHFLDLRMGEVAPASIAVAEPVEMMGQGGQANALRCIALEDAHHGLQLVLVPTRGDPEHFILPLERREVVLTVEPLGMAVRVDFEPLARALVDNAPEFLVAPLPVAGHIEAQPARPALPLPVSGVDGLGPEDPMAQVGLLAPGLLAFHNGG